MNYVREITRPGCTDPVLLAAAIRKMLGTSAPAGFHRVYIWNGREWVKAFYPGSHWDAEYWYAQYKARRPRVCVCWVKHPAESSHAA